MRFKASATIAGVLFFALFATLLLGPGLVYWLFELTPHALGDFLGRRAAMLFLALGTMSLLSRNAPPSPVRHTIARSISLGLVGLAIVGTYEWARGFAGPGIFVAVCAEAAVAAMLLSSVREQE